MSMTITDTWLLQSEAALDNKNVYSGLDSCVDFSDSNKGIEGEASTDTPGTSTNATWITCKTPHGYEYYYNKETGGIYFSCY